MRSAKRWLGLMRRLFCRGFVKWLNQLMSEPGVVPASKAGMGPRAFVALSALSSLVLIMALPATAKAGDPPVVKSPGGTPAKSESAQFTSPAEHGGYRALIVAGHCADARNRIADRLAKDISVAERAALLELHTMATVWDRSGPPAVHDEASNARTPTTFAPSSSVKWGEELDLARADIGRGFYFSAIGRLDRLLTDAPDLIEAARAVELRALTRDVLRFGGGRGGGAAGAAGASSSTSTPGVTVVSDGSPPPSSKAPTSRWYGWQTLIADGAALVTTPIAPLGGFVLYCTGSPIVHLAHGNVKNAGASLGLRVGAPTLGGLIGYGIGRAGDGNSGPSYGTAFLAALGILGGGIAAIVVDHAIIAREPINEADKPSSAAENSERKSAAAKPSERTVAVVATAKPAHKALIESIRPNGGPRKEGGFDVGIVGIW
jgi:hypothetical protein